MYIGEKGELIFDSPEDHDFLDEIIFKYRSDPQYQAALAQASEALNNTFGTEPSEDVSAARLRELMDYAERDALGADADTPLAHPGTPGVPKELRDRLLRRARLQAGGITYTLPKEWTSFILNGAYGLAIRAEVHEAEIQYLQSGELGFHFFGMSDEEARERIEEADRIEREEGVDILDTGEPAVVYAKEKLDKAVHAAGIVLEIVHQYDLGSK